MSVTKLITPGKRPDHPLYKVVRAFYLVIGVLFMLFVPSDPELPVPLYVDWAARIFTMGMMVFISHYFAIVFLWGHVRIMEAHAKAQAKVRGTHG